MSICEDLERILREAAEKAIAEGKIPPVTLPVIILERPREKEFGDYATNLAMVLCREVGQPAREVARILVEKIPIGDVIEKVEIAGMGFINFFLRRERLYQILPDISQKDERYGETSSGEGISVQIEFVSANPTGPLNIVNARAAAVGDSLARLLKTCGYNVKKEYYINDRGRQVELLGQSVETRYRQLLGEEVEIPPEGYQGEYIRDIAREMLQEKGNYYLSLPPSERREIFKNYALTKIIESQKKDLENFGLKFDVWFRESQLHEKGDIEKTLQFLNEKGFVYQEEGAQWFRSTAFGDEKNRVLVRKDGTPTYFLSDVAYHLNKYQRKFKKVIDIWGPDHHGHIPRMKAAVQALGYDSSCLDILIVQQVNLLSGGQPVKMSKRAGEFITMAELIQDVGRDAARFFFLLRSMESHLDFDIDLAKAQSQENPVYYVQYAHARICSILEYARGKGYPVPHPREVNFQLLNEEEELVLIKQMVALPDVVLRAAQDFQPHLLPYYLQDLATQFHSFYTKHRVISENQELSEARLLLCDSVRIVLRNGLTLIGVSAPVKM